MMRYQSVCFGACSAWTSVVVALGESADCISKAKRREFGSYSTQAAQPFVPRCSTIVSRPPGVLVVPCILSQNAKVKLCWVLMTGPPTRICVPALPLKNESPSFELLITTPLEVVVVPPEVSWRSPQHSVQWCAVKAACVVGAAEVVPACATGVGFPPP